MTGDDARKALCLAALRALKHIHPGDRRTAQHILHKTVRKPDALFIFRVLFDVIPHAQRPLLESAFRAFVNSRDFRIVSHLLATCPRSRALTDAFQDFMQDIVATLEGESFWAELRTSCPRSVACVWDAWDMRP